MLVIGAQTGFRTSEAGMMLTMTRLQSGNLLGRRIVDPPALQRQETDRLEQEAPGVANSILEGLDEILTVLRLGLPLQLRRSLACTNIIENMNGTPSGGSVTTSNGGRMPPWCCAGLPPG